MKLKKFLRVIEIAAKLVVVLGGKTTAMISTQM